MNNMLSKKLTELKGEIDPQLNLRDLNTPSEPYFSSWNN